MVNIICTLLKYLNIVFLVIYTYHCFSVFGYKDTVKKNKILSHQRVYMYLFQMSSFGIMYLQTKDMSYLLLNAALFLAVLSVIFFYIKIYSKVSRLVLNNMCMLVIIGMIMISRLEFFLGVKQFMVFSISMIISFIVPVIIRKAKFLSSYNWTKVYAIMGILTLLGVLLWAQTSYGAKLGFELFGVSIQPSEFVKIVYVFFVAGSLYYSTKFKNIVVTTILAGIQVLILVASTDLGAAVIFFVVYLVMLYVATKNLFYAGAGIIGGMVASVIGYYMFSHVRIRVEAWLDPFAVYSTSGYQVAQSLLAIGTGGWSGLGLFEGDPSAIPVAESDFIFSAIAEEMGLIVGICVIMICISCYVMFLNIAMRMKNQFYKLLALGLGTCYMFQTFLTIGGVTKFIPSTGVTLPLVSYGGSSLLSTTVIFAIIQGLYILREDEEADDIKKSRNHNLPGTGTKKKTDAKDGGRTKVKQEKGSKSQSAVNKEKGNKSKSRC